jgi:hypothetical protein
MPRLSMLFECAKERAAVEGWAVNRWEKFPKHDTRTLYWEIEGAVCPPFKSGKRKGKPNWTRRDIATQRTIVVTPEEYEAWAKQWAEKTGGCPACHQTGQEWVSWTKGEGSKFKPCPDCDGTGACTAKEAD